MAILEIKTVPDPVLRKIAVPIDNINSDIIKLSENMVDTMVAARGAGLAANQVGVPVRLVIIEASLNPKGKKTPYHP
jgi:peptide deformylase